MASCSSKRGATSNITATKAAISSAPAQPVRAAAIEAESDHSFKLRVFVAFDAFAVRLPHSLGDHLRKLIEVGRDKFLYLFFPDNKHYTGLDVPRVSETEAGNR